MLQSARSRARGGAQLSSHRCRGAACSLRRSGPRVAPHRLAAGRGRLPAFREAHRGGFRTRRRSSWLRAQKAHHSSHLQQRRSRLGVATMQESSAQNAREGANKYLTANVQTWTVQVHETQKHEQAHRCLTHKEQQRAQAHSGTQQAHRRHTCAEAWHRQLHAEVLARACMRAARKIAYPREQARPMSARAA